MKGLLVPLLLASACAAAASVAALAYGLGHPRSTVLGPAVVRLPAAATGAKEVALTFDDGPTPYTAEILDVLRERKVKATFFLCGAAAEANPELARRIRAEGHAIGNHTYSHPYLHMMSREAIASEIDRTQDVLERVTGERPTMFRPPFGVRWFPLWPVLEERKLEMVLWTARGRDGSLDPAVIEKDVLGRLEPGGILLLHDGDEAKPAARQGDRRATVKALPAIIDGARAAGYSFVPLKS